MTTNNKWLIGIGVALLLVLMFALPFIWHAFYPSAYGYGMMGGYGGGPMMGGGYGYPMRGGGMMGYGFGFGFMLLIPLAVLTLIVLSIAALIKYLRAP